MENDKRIKRNKLNTESRQRTQKRIPLDYKKEVAAVIYAHAESLGIAPITWIKQAIAEKYERETGQELK